MGEAIKTRRGGAAEAFAYISVRFPPGSVCTCSKGTRTLTAPGKTGYALFAVPAAGSWTLHCEEGSSSASTAVSIQQAGQTETVVLKYDSLNIFDGENGGDNTAVTGGWEGIGSTFSLNVTEKSIVFRSGSSGTRCAAVTVRPIPLSDYSTLYFTGINNNSGYYTENYAFLILTEKSLSASSQAALVQMPITLSTVSIDLEALGLNVNTDYYIAISNSSGSKTSDLVKCWAV